LGYAYKVMIIRRGGKRTKRNILIRQQQTTSKARAQRRTTVGEALQKGGIIRTYREKGEGSSQQEEEQKGRAGMAIDRGGQQKLQPLKKNKTRPSCEAKNGAFHGEGTGKTGQKERTGKHVGLSQRSAMQRHTTPDGSGNSKKKIRDKTVRDWGQIDKRTKPKKIARNHLRDRGVNWERMRRAREEKKSREDCSLRKKRRKVGGGGGLELSQSVGEQSQESSQAAGMFPPLGRRRWNADRGKRRAALN